MAYFVVDASVAVRWFVGGADGAVARSWVGPQHRLAAPELILAESANAFRSYMTAGQMSHGEARTGLARIAGIVTLVGHARIVDEALDVAVRYDYSVYDCFYLALAGRTGARFLTADRRAFNRFSETAHAPLIHWYERPLGV